MKINFVEKQTDILYNPPKKKIKLFIKYVNLKIMIIKFV